MAPPLTETAPPWTVPPARFQLPVVVSSARVAPALASVPVRLTTPPLRLKLPNPATVKLPPRFTVELLSDILPALDQLPEILSVLPPPVGLGVTLIWAPRALLPVAACSDSVAPLAACIVPLFCQLLPPTRMVPEPSAAMVPWLTRLTL